MSRWDPKPPLDVNPWSLIPNIGFSRRGTLVAEAFWIAYVAGFFLYRWGNPAVFLAFGFLGGFALYYISDRLGGRVAKELGAAPRIDADSPFQMRLIADVLHIGALVLSASVIATVPF